MSDWPPEGADGNWNDGAGNADTWNDTNAGANGDFGDDAGVNGHGGSGDTNGAAADDDFKCHRCGESGHMARQCPTAGEGSGNDNKCFNCGEEGHHKADCTNPRAEREFTGTCRRCEQVGHRASECPDKPAEKCFNCKQEGHVTAECTSKRIFDKSKIADVNPEVAWENLKKADKERDLDEFRDAFAIYTKAVAEVNYVELEQSFRINNFNIHLIAVEKELPKTHTYVNLQGDLDQKYQVGFHWSDKPKRASQKASWPESAEDNISRLQEAGMPMERGIPKCARCDELGHTARTCPEERMENADKVQVKCVNCEEIGHRARDCPIERKDKFACRNCKQSGHNAAECTEPRSAEGVECRKCNETGHFSKDCPTGGGNACRNCGEEGHMAKECDKPRNPATVTCRNCEEMGHFSKECPKPRDYSKVKCQNCGEMGHTKVRCKAPSAEAGAGDAGGDFGNAGDDFGEPAAGGGGGNDWETAEVGGAEQSLGTGMLSPQIAAGGEDPW